MSNGLPSIDAGVLVTAIVAFVAAASCVRALVASRRGARLAREFPNDRRHRDRTGAYRAVAMLWAVLAGLLALLAIGGPLEVLDRLTEFARGLALGQGWYRDRRPLQAALAVTVLVAGTGVLWFLVPRSRDALPHHGSALVGLVALAALLLVDALSLHAVDAVLRPSWLTVSAGELLMLMAMLPVLRCAMRHAGSC